MLRPAAWVLLAALGALLVAEVGLRVAGYLLLQTRDLRQSEGATTILCIGDSWTFGLEAGDWTRNSYPAQLQSLLDRRLGAGRYRVINRGESGASSTSMARKLPGWLDEFRPAVVLVLGGGLNWSSEATGRMGVEIPGVPSDGLLDRLKLVQLLRRTVFKRKAASVQGVKDQIRAAQQELVSELRARDSEHPPPALPGSGCEPAEQTLAELQRARAEGQLERLRQAAAAQPACVAARVLLAEACLGRGDIPCAREQAERALALDPQQIRAAMVRAFVVDGDPDAFMSGAPNALFDEIRQRDPVAFSWAFRERLLGRLASDVDLCVFFGRLQMVCGRYRELRWARDLEVKLSLSLAEGQGKRILDQLDGVLWSDFAAIHSAARGRGARTMLFNYPRHGTETCRGRAVQMIKRYGEVEGVPVLDLETVLDPRQGDIFGVGHPNAKGYGLVAEAAYRRLLELGWIGAASGGPQPEGRARR